MDRQEWETVQGEVLRVLARYLPVGMEGVASAQARGLEAVLTRGASARSQVADADREVLRQVRDVVLEHRPEMSQVASPAVSSSSHRCPVCREPSMAWAGQAWPCRVWAAGLALGVVADEDAPPVAGAGSTRPGR